MNTSVNAYWLGHSAFKLEAPGGSNILIDPFLTDNPSTPEEWKNPGEVDYIKIADEMNLGTMDLSKLSISRTIM